MQLEPLQEGFAEIPGPDLYAAGDFYLHALARSGSEWDEDDVAFLSRVMSIRARFFEVRDKVQNLMRGREGDAPFLTRCEQAIEDRARLALLEIEALLGDWYPSLYRMDMRH